MRTIFGTLLAALVWILPATARDTLYQTGGYTVYREAPGYCTLFIDTPQASMIRISYRASTGEVNFSWVNPGFQSLGEHGQSVTGAVRFDGGNTWSAFGSISYSSGDGRWGFAFVTDTSLLDRMRDGRNMDVSVNLDRGPLERIELTGSARAVNSLLACAIPGYTPTVRPAPPPPVAEAAPETSDMSVLGRIRLVCARGRGSLFVGSQRVGAAPGDCANDPGVNGGVAMSRTFPSGEQLFLILGPGGQMANSGAAVYVRRGAPPRVVYIDYMVEFAAILGPNRFTAVATGQQDINCRAAYWTTEYRVDWASARIVSSREISRDDGCS